MGHQRLGKLPARRLLPDIVRFLLDGGQPSAALVSKVHDIEHRALEAAQRDPVFIESLWLLMSLPQVAGSANFEQAAAALGIRLAAPLSLPGLLSACDSALERVQRRSSSGTTDLGEIARQSALSSLADAAEARLPRLWTATADDVRHSVAALRSAEASAELVQQFHARFVERVLHYYIDRNLHRLVGVHDATKSLADVASFGGALARHCNEASLITRAFARDWIGKNVYRDGKTISQDDVRRFACYSLEKLRRELAMRMGPA